MGPSPQRLSWLLVTGGPRSISKVVGLVFADSDATPRLAVKYARVREAVPLLIDEANTLRAVQALPTEALSGVPRVVFCGEYNGLMTVVETAFTGTLICDRLRPDNFREICLEATEWLIKLAGTKAPSPQAVWWSRLVEPVLADFRANFGPAVDPKFLDEAEEILKTFGAIPLVCEHRDFSPWNVLNTSTGELAALDWEWAVPDGLPALDLIYFLTYLAFYRERATPARRNRECYRATLDPVSWLGSVRRDCLERYAERIALPTSALEPLRVFVWMLHSRAEYQRLVADTGGNFTPDMLRDTLCLALWEEEMRALTAGV